MVSEVMNIKDRSNKHRQHIKEQIHCFADKGPSIQSYSFSSSHVQMCKLDHKEGWVHKNWCFPTVVLEKILVSSLEYKEIKPVNPKGNQPWIFVGRIDAETEAAVVWPPDLKSWLMKRPWCWERLRVGWKGDDRRWDGWMASLTQWIWVWVSSGR